MRLYKVSRILDRLAATKSEEALAEAADAAFGGAPDGEDEPSGEVVEASVHSFETGLEIAYKAVQNGKTIYRVDADDMDLNVCFFIGTLKEVKARIAALPSEEGEEDEDDE